MTDTRKINKPRVGDTSRQILGVLLPDEFVMFAVDDRYRHADPGQIVCLGTNER